MTAQELEAIVKAFALEFGAFTQKMRDAGRHGTPNSMFRSNISDLAFNDEKAYFGFVRPEEAPTGAYYDLSFVIFPQKDGGKCVVSIGVGSAGYQRDYDIASMSGTRRLFTRLSKNDGNTFIKNDFTDIDTPFRDLVASIMANDATAPLANVISYYSKVLVASCIVEQDEEGLAIIAAWLAQYAKLRNWSCTKAQIKKRDEAVTPHLNIGDHDIAQEISHLIKSRRFVVLQGAPGTGKTYNALKISKQYAKTVFVQFHAETAYSDFVEGIRPCLKGEALRYEPTKGKLVEAIEEALKPEHQDKRVLLIIDEINRANLANVLGPVFYLFEDQAGSREVKLNVAGHELSALPSNLDVIATMNTADRSLAVVDFALRRRFAWYTIRPQKIVPNENQTFHGDLFNKFCAIFDQYATDEELNLQPGPSYFLTPKDNDENVIKDRLIYELMPLIKEYLAEGLMRKASDSFAKLFYEHTDTFLFE